MQPIIFETSERADALNWVKKEILKSNLGLLAFEGYFEIKKDFYAKAKAWIDRAAAQGMLFKDHHRKQWSGF